MKFPHFIKLGLVRPNPWSCLRLLSYPTPNPSVSQPTLPQDVRGSDHFSPPPLYPSLVWLLPVSPGGLQQPGLVAPALAPDSTRVRLLNLSQVMPLLHSNPCSGPFFTQSQSRSPSTAYRAPQDLLHSRFLFLNHTDYTSTTRTLVLLPLSGIFFPLNLLRLDHCIPDDSISIPT